MWVSHRDSDLYWFDNTFDLYLLRTDEEMLEEDEKEHKIKGDHNKERWRWVCQHRNWNAMLGQTV